jgi:hypothetical protein
MHLCAVPFLRYRKTAHVYDVLYMITLRTQIQKISGNKLTTAPDTRTKEPRNGENIE